MKTDTHTALTPEWASSEYHYFRSLLVSDGREILVYTLNSGIRISFIRDEATGRIDLHSHVLSSISIGQASRWRANHFALMRTRLRVLSRQHGFFAEVQDVTFSYVLDRKTDKWAVRKGGFTAGATIFGKGTLSFAEESISIGSGGESAYGIELWQSLIAEEVTTIAPKVNPAAELEQGGGRHGDNAFQHAHRGGSACRQTHV